MHSRGKGHWILNSLVGVLIASFLFAGSAYALPRVGGPAIIDAAWDGTSTLYLVFNEGVTGVSTHYQDFAFTDTTIVPATFADDDGDAVLEITAFVDSVPDGLADSVFISWVEVLAHANGILANETSPIHINNGPVIVSAVLATSMNDDPTDDVLTLVLSEAATDLDSTDFAFSADVFIESLVVAGGGSNWTITNFYWDSATDTALQLLPYISTVAWAAGNDVTNAAGDTANSFVPHVMTNAEGAFVLDASFDSSGTDTVFIVYNMAVRDSVNGADAAAIDVGDYTIGGTGTLDMTGGNPDLSTPVEFPWSPWVVRINNSTTGAAAGDNIAHSGAGVMQNDMWTVSTDVSTTPVSLGPVITASYFKAAISTEDDSVIVHFSSDVTAVDVENAAFLIRGFVPETSPTDWSGTGRRFARAVTSWTEGAAIAIDLAATTVINGSDSNEDATSGVFHPVRDATPPLVTDLISVRTDLVREYSWAGDSSVALIAWNESGGTDKVNYYRVFTRIGDAVSDTFVNENWANGIPVFDPTTERDHPIMAYINITPDSLASNGDVIEAGDVIHFGIVGADWNDNYGVINSAGQYQAITLSQTMVAGHIWAVRDTVPSPDPLFGYGQDDDVIHIIGHWNQAGTAYDSIYADSGAVEAFANVVVYADSVCTDSIIVAHANVSGGWDVVDMGFDRNDGRGRVWLKAYDDWGNGTDSIAIVNDVYSTALGVMADPNNVAMIYANSDSIECRFTFGALGDTTITSGTGTPVYDGYGTFFNYSVRGKMWADFSSIDTYAGNDSIPFENWSSDFVDNDGDWDTTAAAGDTWDPADDVMNWPEPFVDENGNGAYDKGEPFWDLTSGNPSDSSYHGKIYDAGDGNLDYGDTDELVFRAVLDTIRASTSVTDESGLGKAATGFAVIKDLPVQVHTLDNNENAALDTMLIDLDQVAPEVCVTTRIERQDDMFDLDEETNLQTPGNPLFKIGQWLDITFETPSDSLVDYVVVQLKKNGGSWADLDFDPPGDFAADAGYPGTDGVDDDNDGLADSLDLEVLAAYNTPLTDGIDNNNDGTVDNNADTLYADYWHWDDDEDGMLDGTTIGTSVTDGQGNAGSGINYMPWMLDVANTWGTVGDSTGRLRATPGGVVGNEAVSAADSAFRWFDLNGFNINMTLVANLYDLADADTFEIRGLAYDWVGQSIGQKFGYDNDSVAVGHWYMDGSGYVKYDVAERTGNVNPDNSLAERYQLNLEAPDSYIDTTTFKGYDVKAAAGIQVFDSFDSTQNSPADPATYAMLAIIPSAEDVDSVAFDMWNAATNHWDFVGGDNSPPYTYDWTASILSNNPVDNTETEYFRTRSRDNFGNWETPNDTLLSTYDLMFTVVDGVIPITNISECEVIGGNIDTDLSNGCEVPKDSAVIFRIIGSDLDDRDGTGYYDIPFVRFEYRKVVQGKDAATGTWELMGTATGTIDEGDTLADLYPPVAVTWNTTLLEEGDYEIRAWGEDVEGNDNKLTTFIFTAKVRETPLRAYIDPPARIDAETYALYAKVFIHDVEVDHVEFQFYEDTDANGLADDSNLWTTVAIDDNDDTTSTDPGGDVILREGDGTMRTVDSLNVARPMGLFRDFGANDGYIDYDGDGYSPRDPVVLDDGTTPGVYDASDHLIIGTPPVLGDVIVMFDSIEFYADVDSSGTLSFDDWLFRQNMGGFLMDDNDDSLQVWTVMWDVADFGGQVIVRSVATDELGNTDADSIGGGIPTEVLALDTEAPSALVSMIAIGNGGQTYVGAANINNMIVAGDNAFIKIWAETSDDDVANIIFEYSLDGGASWDSIDVNDDNDFYVALDDTVGFTAGDAIVHDVYDDDTTFTVTSTDILMRNGVAPAITDMYGMRIYPLITEDPLGGGDADGDGADGDDGIDVEDAVLPYAVYLDIDALTMMGAFHTDTEVLIRARAKDGVGNTDPFPHYVSIAIQENIPPETDVIYATSNGDTIDVLGPVGDSDAGDQLVVTDTLLNLFVTAEDTTSIESVYVWYRLDPCYYYGGLDAYNIFTNPWVRAGVSADAVYPYNFDWDISAFTDGRYQFYMGAKDEELNETPPYLNPYEFGRLTVSAEIDTALRPLNKMAAATTHYTDMVLDETTVGSELWIRANLSTSTTAADAEGASVTFKYAYRVLDEMLTVQNFWPYISDTVEAVGTMLGDETSYPYSVEVVIAGASGDQVGTYYTNSAFDAIASPTKYDYTVVSGTTIKFGAQLTAADTAYVSYNCGTSWMTIQDSPDDDIDENGWFTTAWDPANPVPAVSSTWRDVVDAYDLIATVTYDFEGECGTALSETDLSEHKIVLLHSVEGPEVTLHGFFWDEEFPFTRYNYPGNPLDWSNGAHNKTKLCGIEYDAFVLVDSVDLPDSVAVVFDGDGVYHSLTQYIEGDTLALTISMNEEDFLLDNQAIWPDSIENVQLYWDINGSSYMYTMYDDGAHNDGAADDGWWAVTVDVPVTSATQTFVYKFDIDMSGDEHTVAFDPRNARSTVPPIVDTSEVVIPSDFWHDNFNADDVPAVGGITNGVHTAVAYAWAGTEVGTNLTSNQGSVYYIIDCVDPGITDLYVFPNIISATAPCDTLTLVAIMEDGSDAIEDILNLDKIAFQFATDDHQTRWIELDDNNTWNDQWNGWMWKGIWPSAWLPNNDNVDNDCDGETDEADEAEYVFSLRVVAVDDAWNVTILETGTVRLDLVPPSIVMTGPEQGTVVAWGDTLTICAMPLTSADAIGLDYYEFWFMESSGVRIQIDPTPMDDGDPMRVPADGENAVCIDFPTDWLSMERDQYVQFYALAYDSACNGCMEPERIVVAVDDMSGPAACVVSFEDCASPMMVTDPHLAISGTSVLVNGKVFRLGDISTVELWIQKVGETATQPLEVISPTSESFSFAFDADVYCDSGATAQIEVWMLARDYDQNPDPNPMKVTVTVDRINPAVNYTMVEFFSTKWYEDDDWDPSTVDSSLVMVVDPITGDVTFQVVTMDADVMSMTLQAAYAFNTRDHNYGDVGAWWSLTSLDFEPQKTIIDGENTYYYWWKQIDADSLLTGMAFEDTIYDWRVKAVDYACNTNILQEDFVIAAWDTVKPICEDFENDAMADDGMGEVASGDIVNLYWRGNDAMTDVENVVFGYYDPWAADTVMIGSVDAVPESLDCPCNYWTAQIAWTTPGPLCMDTDISVYAWAYDTPGNRVRCLQTIRVEDKDPPVGTRLVDVTTDAACALFPREVTETVLNNQTITFSGSADLYAEATGCDSGIATVYFAAINATGDTTYIGAIDRDELTGGQYVIAWNSLALGQTGALKYPDGSYTVWVYAVDLEGNWETWASSYSFIIDNTIPIVLMSSPAVAGATVDVERGSEVPLASKTYTAFQEGSETTETDVKVTWYIRDHNDADCIDGCEDCWTAMYDENDYFGFDSTDVRPDSTRPYSWEWATWRSKTPLEVGNQYDIVSIGEDLYCNTGDPCETWAAGGGITINVTDETAPCATITHLNRYDCNYDVGVIEQPEKERVRGFASLTATILRGDTDTEGVRFEYSLDQGETWILADQDLVTYSNFTWTLNNWDSDQIPEGDILFRAVAWDDVGNVCADPATITLVIDRTAPELEVIEPTTTECPFLFAEDGARVVPLIVKQIADAQGIDDDIFRLQPGWYYEWKKSVDDTTNWSTTGMVEFYHDAGTGYWSGTWNVTDAGVSSGKYDFRVTVHDSACNMTRMVMIEEVVIDVDDPLVQITRFEITRSNGDNDSTTLVSMVSQGVVTDVTKGEEVKIFASVFDNEQDIPGSMELGIDSVYFQMSRDVETDTWWHIDIGQKDTLEVDPLYWANWNTAALPAGDYWIRAYALDVCGNVGYSSIAEVHVIDNVPPRAAVICWEPDIRNDINVTTQVIIYATKWCTQDVDEVMFQYRTAGTYDGGDDYPGKQADEWVTFDIPVQDVIDDSLWMIDLDIGPESMWDVGDQIDLRAVAITWVPGSHDVDKMGSEELGGDHQILYFDANPPVTKTVVVKERFGRDLAPLHEVDGEWTSTDEADAWIHFDKVELLPPGESNFLIDVKVDSTVDSDWVSIAKPWVLVTADRLQDYGGTGLTANFEELVEMDPKWAGDEFDQYLWGGYTYMSLLDSIGCGGYVYINAAVVEDSGNVDTYDEDYEINVDVIRKVIAVHEVTSIGTNGWVAMPGWDYPQITIPAGNGVSGGLLMTTTHTPTFRGMDEARFFIKPIGQAFTFKLLGCAGEGCCGFNDGYWAEVKMSYDEDDLTVVDYLGRTVQVDEGSGILVGHWAGSSWDNNGISNVIVDTVNNVVTFNAEDFCFGMDNEEVWCLLGVTSGTEVTISPWCDGYTSRSPVIVATITDYLADADMDYQDTEIWIDDKLVAAALDSSVSDRDTVIGTPGWAIGNGSFAYEVVEDEEYSATFRYTHSTLTADRLDGGPHTLRIVYTNDDPDYYYTLVKDFYVDIVPVQAEFVGGFLNGPCVSANDCYVNGDDNHPIQVTLTDYESGVITQETRIAGVLNLIWGSWIDFWGSGYGGISIDTLGITWNDSLVIPYQDMGLKMDVWLVDETEDDQTDIDEYMERNLIQAATPAMLVYDPPICEYSYAAMCDTAAYYDAKDPLKVILPLTADLGSYDGHEIEVVLYTSKIEHIGFDSNMGAMFGLTGGGGDDDNEEFTKYIFGPFDCVGNVGSQYVARRFIIDTKAPKVIFSTPITNSIVAPGSDIPVVAAVIDSNGAGVGSGMDTEELEIRLTGPKGLIFEFNPATFEAADTNSTDEAVAANAQAVVAHTKNVGVYVDKVEMVLTKLGDVGAYALALEGADEIGNGFLATHNFSTGSTVLSITDAHVYPNPFDNTVEEAQIVFNLGGQHPARVTVKIFDFAGKLVNEMVHDWTPADGTDVKIPWRGTTNNGTFVANGGYLAHIMVDDGSGVKTANVKIAVRKD